MPQHLMERVEPELITDGVWAHEQTLSAGRPFWVILSTNLAIATWLLGILLAGMGLGSFYAVVALLVGNFIGSFFPAMTALLGPKTRLSQIESARFSLGRQGKKLPAFLNWVSCIGWDSINNIWGCRS